MVKKNKKVPTSGTPGATSSRSKSKSFKNFLQNFGDESQFWWILEILISTSKFWKSLVTRVRPYWDQFWKILTFEFWWNRKVMINHRGGILIFCQILSKLKILDFRVKDFKFCDFVKFWILGLRISNFQFSSIFSSKFIKKWNFCCQNPNFVSRVKDFKFWFSLGLRISNFTNLPKSKFYKNHKFFKKILNITNFVGSRLEKTNKNTKSEIDDLFAAAPKPSEKLAKQKLSSNRQEIREEKIAEKIIAKAKGKRREF